MAMDWTTEAERRTAAQLQVAAEERGTYSQEIDSLPEDVVLGVDGKPINKRHQNMFDEEILLTAKQRMRKDMIENRDKVKEQLKHMTPTDIFILFDEDDSGLISFNEFRKLLPWLNIKISDAKAFRYFRMCDTDGSGEIDIDEFQVALFTCDPTSGNPVGFQPSKNLTPMDAFETFDEDQSGYLDEDEYRYAVDYLSLKASEEQLEKLFFKYDYDFTGKIDYFEFREIFLHICNLRQELEDRGIDVPTLIRRKTMRDLFREVLLEEEERERRALAEARRYKQWLLNVREAKKLIQKAEFRAYQELRAALDAAGHVYVLGTGAYGQFSATEFDKLQTPKFKFEYFEKVLELWKDRLRPQQVIDRLGVVRKQQQQEEARDADRNLSGLAQLTRSMQKQQLSIDPFEEAKQSPFKGLIVSVNTAALWGRRVHQVAVSENVIFALSDTGEVFTWGGNSYWWHEIQPDSVYQTKWRGDTTARSQLLLNTVNKQLPADVSLQQDFESMSPEDKKAEIIKVVAKYYNVWEPPPNPATRMTFLEKDVLAKITYDGVKFSLTCRGKRVGEMTKLEMVDALYADIILEKKLLGERAHKAIREIETQVAGLLKRKKKKLADKFLKRIDEMWQPLREVQAESNAANLSKAEAAVQQQQMKTAQDYEQWRHRVQEKREAMQPSFTPRGNSLQIDLIGATPRAAAMQTPREYQAGVHLSAGAAHAALVHKSGRLYTWGVGAAGRLGLDLTEKGDPQHDTSKPTLVQALSERTVVRVSCGYSHTAAIIAGGELYLWGSTATGKCGLGAVTASEECYCAVPTRVLVGAEDRAVKKVSCGSSHSAAVTEAGQLYVFGCGDGGRLGMGASHYPTLYEPTLVRDLQHERIASVSCGNVTTLVSTEITHVWAGDVEHRHRRLAGGVVYVAGSYNVFGQQYDSFTKLHIGSGGDQGKDELSEFEGVPIKHVSAGYFHSLLLSAQGEVYCWGHNNKGCCGAPPVVRFLHQPTAVPIFYTSPSNLSLGKRAYSSSVYNMREAKYAVNGRKDGNGVNRSACTQLENQPWIEIDLGQAAMIDKIVVWNRTDEPRDRNEPRDLYTARLFPCWIMVGRNAFQKPADVVTMKENLRCAVSRAKLTENKRVSTWHCPAHTQARYVRLQLERYSTLSVAEIEVFGHWGSGAAARGVGRVSFAAAGRDVSVCVVRASSDPRDVEFAFKRAAYADAMNADVLRQLETYTLEYDKFGRGEVLRRSSNSSGNNNGSGGGVDCCICRGLDKCEACVFYDTFDRDIQRMPPVIGGRRRRLNSISEYLISSNKPALQPVLIPTSKRPSKWELRAKAIFGERFDFRAFFRTPKKAYITPQEALEANPREMMQQLQYVRRIDDERIEQKQKEEEDSKQKAQLERGLGRSGQQKLDDGRSSRRRAARRKRSGKVGSIDDDDNGDLGTQTESESAAGSRLGSAHSGGDFDELESFLAPQSAGSGSSSNQQNQQQQKFYSGNLSVSANSLNSESILPSSSVGESVLRHPPTTAAAAIAAKTSGGYSSTGKGKLFAEGDVLATGHSVKAAYPRSIAQQIGDSYETAQKQQQQRQQQLLEAEQQRKQTRDNNFFGKNKKS